MSAGGAGDRETGRIVSHESADIIRMLDAEWDEWGDASVDLYPIVPAGPDLDPTQPHDRS